MVVLQLFLGPVNGRNCYFSIQFQRDEEVARIANEREGNEDASFTRKQLIEDDLKRQTH